MVLSKELAKRGVACGEMVTVIVEGVTGGKQRTVLNEVAFRRHRLVGYMKAAEQIKMFAKVSGVSDWLVYDSAAKNIYWVHFKWRTYVLEQVAQWNEGTMSFDVREIEGVENQRAFWSFAFKMEEMEKSA